MRKKKENMNRLFKDPFMEAINDWFTQEVESSSPRTKITKTEGEYKLFMSLPGLSKEDIKISVKDQVLKIAYTKQEKNELSHFIRNFSKEYAIPENVIDSEIEAKLDNGVLEMRFPFDKKKPAERLINLK